MLRTVLSFFLTVEVLLTVSVNISSGDVTSCSLVDKYKPFGETCCLFSFSSTLKMEATVLSKTLRYF